MMEDLATLHLVTMPSGDFSDVQMPLVLIQVRFHSNFVGKLRGELLSLCRVLLWWRIDSFDTAVKRTRAGKSAL
jgi:hypothetical protein